MQYKGEKLLLLVLFISFFFSVKSFADEIVIFEEDFSSVTSGNSNSSTGSNSSLKSLEHFTSFSYIYKAGGAIRIGQTTESGSITTEGMDLTGYEGTFKVIVGVKGWSSILSDLIITMTNSAGDTCSKTLTYTATRSDSFEKIEVDFTGGDTLSTLTFSTIDGCLFLNYIKVYYEDSGIYTVNTPTLSVADGTTFAENESIKVKATCTTVGSTIYYTTDGSTPSDESTEFPSSGLIITETTTLSVIAIASGYNDSKVVTATYTMINDSILHCALVGCLLSNESYHAMLSTQNTNSNKMDAEKVYVVNSKLIYKDAIDSVNLLVELIC